VKSKLLVWIIAGCMISACSGGSGAPPPPTLVLSVQDQTEYDQAVAQASDYCLKNYGNMARTHDTWSGKPGDVTFTCQP
jgi:hypothetical protein